ncbi:MAG: HEPN domain-containing protein [Bacteroidota bacterium]|nr:HEPN domain-containing protein [Bacteroidota bacterium]
MGSFEIWLDIAESDLKASRILYENKQYRTSYFFFQQASEKANKAYALISNQLTDSQFEDIGHKQFKIHRNLIEVQKRKVAFLLSNNIPELPFNKKRSKIDLNKQKEMLNEGVSYIDSLNNLDLVNISSVELNKLINEIKKNIPKEIVLPVNIGTHFEHSFQVLNEWLNQIDNDKVAEYQKNISELSNNKDLKEFLIKLFPIVLKKMGDISFVLIVLLSCAYITNQHVSKTRYPEQNHDPMSLYNKSLPAVKKQLDFMNFLEMAINKLRALNNCEH